MNETPAAQDISLESLVAQLADEFTARLERGERPAIDEYVQRHPRHAGVIRNLLTARAPSCRCAQYIELCGKDPNATD